MNGKDHFPFFVALALLAMAALSGSGCSGVNKLHGGMSEKNPDWRNLYYFHADDSLWIVKPLPAAGNIFTGAVYNAEDVVKLRNVHIYASPLSSVTIADQVLTVPMDNIVKVENHKISAGMILGSVGLLALLFMVPVFL